MRELLCLLCLLCLIGCGSTVPVSISTSDAGPEVSVFPRDASSADASEASIPPVDRPEDVLLVEIAPGDVLALDRATDGPSGEIGTMPADHVVPVLDVAADRGSDAGGQGDRAPEVSAPDAGPPDAGPCGHRGEPCCWGGGSLCLDDLTCRGAMVTVCACGDPGEICCPGLLCNTIPGRTNTCRMVGSRRVCG